MAASDTDDFESWIADQARFSAASMERAISATGLRRERAVFGQLVVPAPGSVLASPEIGAAMTKASGFISTYTGASEYLTDLEKKSTSFPEEQLANLQFFRAEANEMKYGLVDPAVEAVKAA